MLKHLWKRVKSIELLRNIIANTFYYIKNVRRNVNGTGNQIQIDIQNNFPFINNVVFEIAGNNNLILVSSGDRLSNCKISICGNNNEIILERNGHEKILRLFFIKDHQTLIIPIVENEKKYLNCWGWVLWGCNG